MLTRYHHYLNLLCKKYVEGGQLKKTIKYINKEIGKTAGTETNAFYTNRQYHEAIATFCQMMQLKAQSILGQMAGSVPSTWEEQKAHPELLINCEGINLRKMGGLGY